MFSLDSPSSMAFGMPDWRGGVQRFAGQTAEALKSAGSYAFQAVVSPFSVVADPVGKAVNKIGDETAGLIRATTSATESVGKGLSSGFKWAMFLIVIGIALYALAILSPFIPKGENRG